MGEPSKMLQRRRRQAHPAGIAVAVYVSATLAAIAGCGSGQTAASQAKSHASGSTISASEALNLAASQSARVTSMVASVNMTSSNTATGFAGTISLQLKPHLLLGLNLNLPPSAGAGSLKEIVTSKSIYLNITNLSTVAGKPWVKISLSAFPKQSSAAITSVFQSLEHSNPLAQARFFKVSKNVHAVGKQTINGVPTTEYAGSYRPSDALGELPPTLRKQFGSTLRALGNHPIPFHIWIDAQHLVRKTVTSEKLDGQSMEVVYTVKSVNQPIATKIPNPSQVRSISSFGSLG